MRIAQAVVATRLRIERDIVGSRLACRASRRSTLCNREKNSTIWTAALDELDELAELEDQKRLFTDVNKVHGDRLPWGIWELKGGEESIPSVVPELISLAVWVCQDIFFHV